MASLAHDVSRELRDPHSGKWSKGGSVLDRMAHEAAGGHERTLAQVHGIKPGGGKQVNGHWVDRPSSEGGKFRVKLKKPGERGRDTRTYSSPEDAARALHTGSHTSPATERAAKDVTGSPPKLSGPEDIVRKIGSEEAARRKQEETTTATLRKLRGKPEVRTVTAKDLKPGMVVSSGHWQAPSGPHEITKLEKSGAGSRSGGVRYSQGIYHTASTHVHHKDGQYQVSNNTRFKVHSEAPATDERPYRDTPEDKLREMVQRGGNTPAAHELTRRIVAAQKSRTEAENKASGRGGTTVHSGPIGGVPESPAKQQARAAAEPNAKAANDLFRQRNAQRKKLTDQGIPIPPHSADMKPGSAAAEYAEATAHIHEGRYQSGITSLDKAITKANQNHDTRLVSRLVRYRDSLTRAAAPEGYARRTAAAAGEITHFNGARITSMSDRQLQNAAKKPGSPKAIKDEIARRYRQAKLKEIGHVRG